MHYDNIWGSRKDSQLVLGTIKCVLNAFDIDVERVRQRTHFE